MPLKPELLVLCTELEKEFGQIPEGRRTLLEGLGRYMMEKHKAELPIRLTVICTHNSRRSHIGQLWLWAAASFYSLEKVETFSGGTEATAFHPHAVRALQKVGFSIRKITESSNPHYEVVAGDGLPAQFLFSKKFNDNANPARDFAAVLVCSDADEACPYVPGADARFFIPYDDPKQFDGTGREEEAYDDCCRKMGREMLFAMWKGCHNRPGPMGI